MSCCFLSPMSPTSLVLTCTWCLKQPQSESISTSGNLQSASALLNLHALTGCDTTSFICNNSKKSVWKVFLQHHKLPFSKGEGELTKGKMKAVEKFVCKMYKLDHIGSVDEAWVFFVLEERKAMPCHALSVDVKRVHYHTMVRKQALCSESHLPNPETLGWKKIAENKLQSLLMTQDTIPKACQEIISCSCSTGCAYPRCSCKKANCFVPEFVKESLCVQNNQCQRKFL